MATIPKNKHEWQSKKSHANSSKAQNHLIIKSMREMVGRLNYYQFHNGKRVDSFNEHQVINTLRSINQFNNILKSRGQPELKFFLR